MSERVAGRRRKDGDTRQITLTVPARMFEYLSLIAEDSIDGTSPSALVLTYVTERLHQVVREDETLRLRAQVSKKRAEAAIEGEAT